MKTPLDTVLRPNNVSFYLNLAEYNTVKDAAENAGITPQHGLKLLKIWDECGLIKQWVSGGKRYIYTSKGVRLRTLFLQLQEIEEFLPYE